jgi:methanogenic corrinoid protein MtbC1
MSSDEINTAILELSKSGPNSAIFIDQLIVSMVDMDELQFDRVLNSLIRKIGFERCITEVVYPFLEKIGVMWQTGSITPAHEHFISNLIRQKLIASIAALPVPVRSTKKVMLFLPEGELHEMGLLFSHYLTKRNGFKTYYLGQSLPHEDLKAVYQVHQPEIMITSVVSTPSMKHFEKYLHQLSKDFSKSIIFASGPQVRNSAFRIPKNVKPFYKATELPSLLKNV